MRFPTLFVMLLALFLVAVLCDTLDDSPMPEVLKKVKKGKMTSQSKKTGKGNVDGDQTSNSNGNGKGSGNGGATGSGNGIGKGNSQQAPMLWSDLMASVNKPIPDLESMPKCVNKCMGPNALAKEVCGSLTTFQSTKADCLCSKLDALINLSVTCAQNDKEDESCLQIVNNKVQLRNFKRYIRDTCGVPYDPKSNLWTDLMGSIGIDMSYEFDSCSDYCLGHAATSPGFCASGEFAQSNGLCMCGSKFAGYKQGVKDCVAKTTTQNCPQLLNNKKDYADFLDYLEVSCTPAP